MERPLLLPLVSLIAGLAIADAFSIPLDATLLGAAFVCALLSLFIKNNLPFLIFLAVCFFLLGHLSLQPFLFPHFAPEHIVSHASDEPIVVEGVVDSRPQAQAKGGRLWLEVESIVEAGIHHKSSGRLILFIDSGRIPYVTGDRIRFSSRISRPRALSLPGEFDFARYLAFHKTYATAFVAQADDVVLVAKGADSSWNSRIDTLAADLGAFIDRRVPGEEGAILRALLLGDMGNVPQETKDAYTRAGVNHILSISGFHVSIIAVFIFTVFFFILKRIPLLLVYLNLRRTLLVATIPVLFFYLLLSGGAPATLRSVIMIASYILALSLSRETDAINSLLLAAFVILILSPSALFDLSFQLSFLALWGIIVLTPLFMSPFKGLPEGVGKKLLMLFFASAAATVATIVPVAHYFHRTSIAGLVTNFMVVPVIGYGAVVAGFTALPFVYLLPSLAGYLISLAALLVHYADKAIVLCAKLPLLPAFAPSQPQLLLSYLILAILTFMKQGKVRSWGCCFSILLFFGFGFIPSHSSGQLYLTFFSIGQGESTLITFPDGRHMLVDGGGATREGGRDFGERLLAPALWEMGVRTLDYVVLSHPHPDHMLGLKFILRTFRVGEFWEGEATEVTDDYLELKEIISQRRVPVVKVHSSDPPRIIGGASIEVLAPLAGKVADLPNKYSPANEGSIVFRLTQGNFSALFTGDIGSYTESLLLDAPFSLRSTLLKVPHHGSRFSSTVPFIKAVSPRFAVVSAGYKNSFHLPAAQTLKTLRQNGALVGRTDLDGTIEVSCDARGENIVIRGSRAPFPLAKL